MLITGIKITVSKRAVATHVDLVVIKLKNVIIKRIKNKESWRGAYIKREDL